MDAIKSSICGTSIMLVGRAVAEGRAVGPWPPQLFPVNKFSNQPHCKFYNKVIYYQAYDYVINAICERFDQPDYKMYAIMHNILFMSMGGKNVEEQMDEVVFNGKDGSQVSFRRLYNLQLLPIILSSCKDTSIHDIFVMVRNMSQANRVIISEVVTLLKLLIVVPESDAESERGFSTMRRIKNDLRSTMGDNRLDNLKWRFVYIKNLWTRLTW